MEDSTQIRIVTHFRKHYAGRVAHVPNGGKRGKLQAIRFKAMGVAPGHPDLVFYTPVGVFLMEVKDGKGKPSKAQEDFIADLTEMGFPVAVVWTLEAAAKQMVEWRFPLKIEMKRRQAETGF